MSGSIVWSETFHPISDRVTPLMAVIFQELSLLEQAGCTPPIAVSSRRLNGVTLLQTRHYDLSNIRYHPFYGTFFYRDNEEFRRLNMEAVTFYPPGSYSRVAEIAAQFDQEATEFEEREQARLAGLPDSERTPPSFTPPRYTEEYIDSVTQDSFMDVLAADDHHKIKKYKLRWIRAPRDIYKKIMTLEDGRETS